MKLQRKSGLRALAVGAAALSGALVLTACGSDNNSGSSSPSGQASNNAAGNIKCGGKGNLLASGSTAQKNAMDVWVKNYMQSCTGTQINYKATGSGAGVTEFLQGSTAFAGSDSALKPEEVAKSKSVCKGGEAIDLPMVGGPIAVGYNVPGVDNLVLDAPTLAKIFDSKITKWDAPEIKKLNPNAKLPSTSIQAFHRSDESGTTDNFTKYLKGAAPADWSYSGGKAWQAKGGQSAPQSSGVASQVKQTAGAIGYFELSYATASNIPTVKIATGAAAPVEASSDAASKAIADAKITGTGNDLALKLNYATKTDGAYPIVLVTYEIACDKGNKPETLDATKAFLSYLASDDGQKGLSGQGYAPLPAEIATKVRTAVSALS
ncbi:MULTISPECIES: phosphate ABC transporter substrate-binding protein PstS [Streptomycetaceae]|uniref:Phosphate-binding protein n=1 Tax=Streptantibioticus cattleyicolor (strain ATCC 35852 / DSM 46488 / JCM 4925 / NBRC 14057 / NRRL 8057) TaxID=1003195 RepID=F8K155_STREN|nr:phosphate ABC transporter substrate-binding protein PstS [Streptantibioticus cattleyicolor]AEW94933.1 phosphate-binding protein precursor [Streptantibioticus cattleyicolor NRRL 8057 = DSM 46488]MYS59538.1 phosphate ABC transporter substrate-binding protein PstS [Streptomyces sp. SID5468]CCB75283.1 Phosphate-binding protein pstS 3 [Streptantibioticus cattleyicolor NRRL 8057 = DSM 46488]